MLYLRGTNTHRNRTECPVGRSVRITTDDSHSWLRDPELRTDSMDNALLLIPHGMQTDTEFLTVFAQRAHLRAGGFLFNLQQVTFSNAFGRDVMILRSQMQLRVPHGSAIHPQSVKGLRASNLV